MNPRMLLAAAALWAAAATGLPAFDKVSIYSDFQPDLFGRALERKGPTAFHARDFQDASTFDAQAPVGFLTAVVIDRGLVDGLERELRGFRERAVGAPGSAETAWLWVESATGRDVITYYDPDAGLEFSFSAEPPGREVLSVIERTYARDPRTRAEVLAHYRSRYVIRVHRAENLIDSTTTQITFEEALAVATLVGDRVQPLWGIHDGLSFLSPALAALRKDSTAKLADYRPWTTNAEAMRAFISRISRMTGDFPRNLFHETIAMMKFSSAAEPQLPEEFIVRKSGAAREFAFFYYDILVRRGYEARILAVKKAGTETDIDYVAIYRANDRTNWGALTVREIYPNQARDFRRIPALIHGPPAVYIVIDPADFFQDKQLTWPDRPGAGWTDSPR